MKCSCTYCRQALALLPSRKGHVFLRRACLRYCLPSYENSSPVVADGLPAVTWKSDKQRHF